MALDDEHTRDRRTYERQRAQLTTLNSLGLDEIEAVDYVLMLSRDEEERRRAAIPAAEGVFQDDFDDIPATEPTSAGIDRHPTPVPFSRNIPSPSLRLEVRSSPASLRTSVSPPLRSRVEVAARMRPESMEAGFGSHPASFPPTFPSHRSVEPTPESTPPSLADADHFPAMASSHSSRESTRSISTSPDNKSSVSWSSVLRVSSGSNSPSPARSFVAPGVPASFGRRSSFAVSSGPSLLAASLQSYQTSHASTLADSTDSEDADLALAIRLSLADSLEDGRSDE